MWLRARDEAATSAFAFMIAGVIFVAAVGSVTYYTSTYPVDREAADRAVLQNKATALVTALSQSPGVGGVDDLARFGLAQPGGGLDPLRMDTLCGAGIETQPGNGKFSYQQIADSLDIQDEQFLLRVSPATSVDVELSQIKTAYIEALKPDVQTNWIDGDAFSEGEGHLINEIKNTIAAGGIPSSEDYMAIFEGWVSTSVLEERTAFKNMGLDYDDRPNVESQHVPDEVITLTEEVVDPITLEVIVPEVNVSVKATMLENGLNPSGDVFFDRPEVLEDVLVTRLPEYHLLVVGTGVDHDAITPDVREAIQSWVADGNMVMVLGGWEDWATWMDDLGGGATTVETANTYDPLLLHPIFQAPFAVEPEKYVHKEAPPYHGAGTETPWGDGVFDHVLVGDAEDQDDLRSFLSLSRCGAFGDGFVALSSYQATYGASSAGTVLRETHASIMDEQSSLGMPPDEYESNKQEKPREGIDVCSGIEVVGCVNVDTARAAPAEYFLTNVVHFGKTRHLHLEVGEPMPLDRPVAYAHRLTWIDDPVFGQVPMNIEVFVVAK